MFFATRINGGLISFTSAKERANWVKGNKTRSKVTKAAAIKIMITNKNTYMEKSIEGELVTVLTVAVFAQTVK